MSTMNDESIRNIAYRLWLADGSQPGKDQEYWFRAQEEYSVGSQGGSVDADSNKAVQRSQSAAEVGTVLHGNIDAATPERILGWLAAKTPSDPRVVVLLSDGEEVARATACLLRQDLKNAGIGDGCHGFVIPLANVAPKIFKTRLSLIDEGTRQPVPDRYKKLDSFGSDVR